MIQKENVIVILLHICIYSHMVLTLYGLICLLLYLLTKGSSLFPNLFLAVIIILAESHTCGIVCTLDLS